MIYSILPPKAEEGWIKPDQCQVNSTWLELTYYIETLGLLVKTASQSVILTLSGPRGGWKSFFLALMKEIHKTRLISEKSYWNS